MRDVAVGDIWMWRPSPNSYGGNSPEYWLISDQDATGQWWAISLTNEADRGDEIDITVDDLSVDWTKVA